MKNEIFEVMAAMYDTPLFCEFCCVVENKDGHPDYDGQGHYICRDCAHQKGLEFCIQCEAIDDGDGTYTEDGYICVNCREGLEYDAKCRESDENDYRHETGKMKS